MKYELKISSAAITTAGGGETYITLFRDVFHFNPITESGRVLEFISKILPAVNWKLDDGTDAKGTNWCQYVYYAGGDEEAEHCVIATWSLL